MRALTKLVPILGLLCTVTVIHADSGTHGTANGAASGDPPQRTVKMSAADMEAGSLKIEAQLQGDMRSAMHLKETARKQKDVIKLGCVNDRLIQIKAQSNIADMQNQELHVALDKGAPETSSLYDQLAQTGEGVRRLREEASTCVGEPELTKLIDGTEVSSPNIVDDPTADNPFQNPVGGVDIEPPGFASPFF
jgi:hypothetical protein